MTEGKVGSPAMVAVAFTRTCGWQARDRSDDELRDWRGYVGWARSAGALRREDARRQAGLNMMRPGAAMRALDRARALRTSIYRLLVACATGQRPPAADVKALNGLLSALVRRRELAPAGSRLVWRWRSEASSHPDYILWQVAVSAAVLLSGEAGTRLRLCMSADCGWLFVDGSRNGMRRWCSMDACGNVEKARRYRARSRRHPE